MNNIMRRTRLLPLCFLASLLFTCSSALPGQSAAPSIRIVEPVNESRLATLKGSVHPYAISKNDRGRVSGDLQMGDLILVLSRSAAQQAAFDKFVAAQYELNSPDFHRWLTAEQIGEQFGPSETDISTISNWLIGRGFSVDEVSKDRMSIRFSGSASQVESAFHTEIHNLDVKGETHIANMTDVKIPEALAPAVVGVKALHNFFARPLHRIGPQLRRDPSTGKWTPANTKTALQSIHGSKAETSIKSARPNFGVTSGNYQYELIVPYDLATIYNIKPSWNASINGTGQTIAIAGTSNIVLSDVATFRQATGLPANVPQVIITNSDPGTTTAALVEDRLENTLDVEWAGAVATGAKIVLVASSAPTQSTDPLYLSESYIVQNKTAPIMNVSYGECELFMGTAGNAEYNSLWQTAAAEGIAVFVSTGDSGSASCDQGEETNANYYAAMYGLSVNGMSSTPYNVAVGGTDLNWTDANWASTNSNLNLSNALGYIPEVPWNDSISNPLAVSALNSSNGTNYDAENWANIIAADYYNSGTINLNTYTSYIEADGGSGGVSSCTVNSTTSSTNNPAPSSCSGGYAQPAWQAGVPGIVSTDKRAIPDVSFFASDGVLGSAYLICDTFWPNSAGTGGVAATCDYSSSNALAEAVGGTSVASPVMAGVMALINQKAGASQGFPNAQLYALASKQNYSSCSAESVTAASSCYFNDVDTGNIAMPCDHADGSPNCPLLHSGDTLGILSGYSAGVGYDKATGLGSLNVANVVNGWATANTNPAFALAGTAVSVAAGATTGNTSTISIAPSGGFTGSVTLSCTVTGSPAGATSPVTCSIPPSTTVGANGGSAVLTINSTAATTLGTYAITINGTSGSISETAQVAVTVTTAAVPPVTATYSLLPTTPAAVNRGTSGASTVTVSSNTGYVGTVTLTCALTSSPSGASATYAPTCSGSQTVTLSSTTASGTATFTASTTAATTAALAHPASEGKGGWIGAGGGAVLALLMFFGVPARRRSWLSMLGVLVMLTALGSLAGCSSGGSKSGSSGGNTSTGTPGTTSGAYTFTVTGTGNDSAKTIATATFTLTVN